MRRSDAGVAKLVDATGLGPVAYKRCIGSSPILRTTVEYLCV